MFVVLTQGSKQYRVAENDRILVESLPHKEGEHVEIKDVLMLCHEGKVTLGTPFVPGASVRALVAGHLKGPKAEGLVFKRRKRSRRRVGHRQGYTELLIERIELGGKPAAGKPAEKTGAKDKAAVRGKKDTPEQGGS